MSKELSVPISWLEIRKPGENAGPLDPKPINSRPSNWLPNHKETLASARRSWTMPNVFNFLESPKQSLRFLMQKNH